MLALAIVPAFALRAPLFGLGDLDYDEGVYWASLASMLTGHQLFCQVYSSQPPAFLPLMLPGYAAFGQSIAVLRATVSIAWLAGAVAAYVLASRLGSRLGGVVVAGFLLVDPIAFDQSVIFQAEGIAIPLGLVGLALAAAAPEGGRAAAPALLGAGMALALGSLAKLLDVAMVPPLLALVVLPARGRGHRALAGRLGLVGLGACLAGALVLLPQHACWGAMWNQAVAAHLQGGRRNPLGLRLSAFYEDRFELPLLAAAGMGLLAASLWARALALTAGSWLVAAAAVLATVQPLWSHHFSALVAPLALGAAGLGAAAERVLPRRLPVAWVLAALIALGLWPLGAARAAALQAAVLPDAPVVASLVQHTHAGQEVVTDDQFGAAVVKRQVPAQLVDTSFQRICCGGLDAALIEAVIRRDGVRAVFVGGRLREVEGLEAWLARNFRRALRVPGYGVLYIE